MFRKFWLKKMEPSAPTALIADDQVMTGSERLNALNAFADSYADQGIAVQVWHNGERQAVLTWGDLRMIAAELNAYDYGYRAV